MEIAEFVDARRARWQELETLLQKAEVQGLQRLSLEEAHALSRTYRSTSADLLWVRARGAQVEVADYLNDLVGRAYALTYPGRRVRGAAVWRFFASDFPGLIRVEWKAMLASFLLFFAGTGFGWLGMVFDPEGARYLVPEQHKKLDPTKRAEEKAKEDVASAQEQAAFTSFLFTHNITVAFVAFALGVTLGIGTAVMLFINGIMLGSLAQVYAAKGLAGWFWAWILPHGIPEITAICIAGGAGLLLARGLAAPKGLSRGTALRKEAVPAVKLLLGTTALFVLAGCIEGTISQIHPPRLPVWFKIGFALVVGAGVYAYLLSGFLFKGRRAP
ncbi:MAG TPA: stage II sporulation protein M [Myxococcaceae bacterium]|nr:stage II sporulation protein M [Myxococcaceae bacterium]